MRAALTVSVVASALALAACAPMDAGGQAWAMPYGGGSPRARECFSPSQVTNFTQGRSNQLFLRVGRNAVYELSAAGGCQDMDFAMQIALLPDAGMAGSRLCTNDWARIVTSGSAASASVCRVRISRQLTEAEVAALPSRQRP